MFSYNSNDEKGGQRGDRLWPWTLGRGQRERLICYPLLIPAATSMHPPWCVPALCPQEPGHPHWSAEPARKRQPSGQQMAICPTLTSGHQHPSLQESKHTGLRKCVPVPPIPHPSLFVLLFFSRVSQSWARTWGLSSASSLEARRTTWALPLAPQLRQVETVGRHSYPTLPVPRIQK